MTDLITVVVGDKAVKMSVLDAATFEAFRASMQADHKSVIEMKDTEIGELKAKLADAEKAVLSDDDLDKMLQKRSALVDLAKKIKTDLVADGKTDDEIRSEAVAKQFGDEAIKDASAAEIAGMFKIATSKADVNDKARTALGDVKQVTADSWDKFVKKGDK